MTATQDHDVVELLKGQHNRIKSLFSEIERSQGGAKQRPFEELVRLLSVHESAEEQVVHPLARRATAPGVVDQRLQEEHKAKEALAELVRLGVEHPDFDRRIASFAEEVSRHAAKEEATEFAQIEVEYSLEERRKLAQAVRVAEEVAPTRPHPHAGEGPAENAVAGPALAVVDRVRDAARAAVQKEDDEPGSGSEPR